MSTPAFPSLGDALAHFVRRQGLTMTTFAQRLGVTPSTLSRMRTGQRLPSEAQLASWSDALHLGAEDRRALADLLALARTPPEVRARLAQAEQHVDVERDRRERLAQDYGEYRRAQRFHDGWWLTFSRSFRSDGTVQRSLLRIAGNRAELEVRELGHVQFSYHGEVEALGDKIFLRLSEDRGAFEHVQIILDSLFDYREPSFLYGLVCGISGKSAHHPLSYPAAARLLVMHIGRESEFPADGATMQRVMQVLGGFKADQLRQLWPTFLGNADWHAQCLRLGDEPLDAAILRLIDNRQRDGEDVLRAVLG